MLSLAVVVLLAGCDNNRQGLQTEGIKIGDLAPTGRSGRPVRPRALNTTNIEVLTFELSVENMSRLSDAWKILTTGAIRYNNAAGFAANGLQAGTGQYTDFQKIIAYLDAAGAEKLVVTSLLLSDGQAQVLNLGRLTRKTTVSYIGRNGAIQTTETGSGVLGLQVSARQFSGSREVANVNLVPVISTYTEGLPKELVERLRENDVRISSAGLRVIMKQGDIFMLAPDEYSPDETPAAGRFFTRPGPKPAVIVLLFVCTSIS